MFVRALVAAAILTPSYVHAQAPAEVPTFEARLRSASELLSRFEYFAGLVGQGEPAKQFRGLMASLKTEKGGIEGVDTERPFGAYAFLKPNVVDSPFVIFAPIKDQENFLQMLRNRLQYDGVEKDGLHTMPLPKINEPLHLRFANGYVYISLRAAALDLKVLLKPADFFARDDGSVASLILRIDRVPAELKKMVLGQVELRLNDGLAAQGPPAERNLKGLLHDSLLAAVKSVFEDGKDLMVRIHIEPKSDDLKAEVNLTAKPGTALAKTLAAAGSTKSLPAAIVMTRQPILGATVAVTIPAGYRERYVAAIEGIFRDLIAGVPEESRGLAKQFVDAMLPTLKAGTLDAAFALQGAGGEPRQLLGAIRVVDAKTVLELMKSMTRFLPAPLAKIEYDKEKVGNFALHRIELTAMKESDVKRFGSRILWLATSPEYIVLGLEDDGAELKKALLLKPATVPLLEISTATATMLPFTEKELSADKIAGLVQQVFGNTTPRGSDVVRFTIAGGESLDLKLTWKGKALQFSYLMSEAKKQK